MTEEWPDSIFETPPTWGDTKFLDEKTLQRALGFLREDLGWDMDASECREWVHRGNGEYRTPFSGNVRWEWRMRFRKSTLKGEWEPELGETA